MYNAQEGGVIERAWAGGKEGMGVTEKVLESVEVSLIEVVPTRKLWENV